MFYRYLFFVLMALSFCAQPRLRAEEHDHDHDKKCLDHHGASSKKESSHAVHAEKEDIVHLNAEQLKMAELDICSVTSGKLVKTLDGPGEITVNEDRVAHITSRVPGVAIQARKTIGDKVTEGETLAILESPELGNAKIDYITARLNMDLARFDLEREQVIHDNTKKLLDVLKAEPEHMEIEKKIGALSIGENKSKLLSAYYTVRLARATWNRSRKLLEDKITSQSEYELSSKQFESAAAEYQGVFEDVDFNHRQRLLQTQRALRVAETALQNSERRLHILGVSEERLSAIQKEDEQVARYELRAPFAGVIIEKHITNGEHIETTSNCFTIADLSVVWCNVRIYPKDLKRVTVGQIVRIKFSEEDAPLNGKIAMIHPVVSDKTRAAFARILLNNASGHLRPGMFVTGAIVLEEYEAPIVAPIGAIQTFEGKDVVFVTGDCEGEFEAKPVQRGYSDGVMVEIKSGLAVGQKIVVRNSFILKAELSKGEGHHDH